MDFRCVSQAARMVLAITLSLVSAAAQQNNPGPAAPIAGGSVLSSPLEYQVFQRESRLKGAIVIKGRAGLPVEKVEARVSGESLIGTLKPKWRRLELDPKTGEFHSDLKTVPGGFYEVDVRVRHAAHRVEALTVPHVGVGEVFVISGQSNSTNYGEVPQVTKTGMVASFSGITWQLANDPQQGVQDNSKKGSFIPSLGDALYEKYRVPIGIASVGHGSSSVRQWLPAGEPIEVMPTMTRYVIRDADGTLTSDGTLFNGMMLRIRQLGVHGFRAVLWHQGESDSHQPPEHEISADTYRRMLEHIIQETRRQAGWNIPWFVAQATYHTPDDTSCPPIREAQRKLWQNGLALQGPDTDTLKAPYRENNGKGTHLNDAGLKAHGLLWAQSVEIYLDPLLR
jgi:hypothetical protein